MKLTKTRLSLLLIFVLALILRVIAAFNTHVSTDEMFYSIIPLNILSADRLGTVIQSQLYFYLADLGYQLFGGITAISVRLPSIIFGALTVFVIFFISMELFKNRKVSLLSSFLFAVSGYALLYNLETDMPAFFFSLLSMLYFIRALHGNYKNLYLASLFLALAVMIKTIVVFFIPAYLIVLILYIFKEKKFVNDKEGFRLDKKLTTSVFWALVIGILVISPVFIYNFFLYQETGLTDFYFSSLGFGQNLYEHLQNKPWDHGTLWSVVKSKSSELIRIDSIIFVFGMLGILLSWRKNKYVSLLLISSLLFLVGYIAGVTGSSTHFLWVPIVLSIFASYGIFYTGAYIKKKFKLNYLAPILIIFAILVSSIVMQDILDQREKSITLLMRDYVHNEIPEDAIVVIDSRIYFGLNAWIFNDRHYVSDRDFMSLVNTPSGQIMGEVIRVPLYYVECGPGTNCGWKPEDFANVAPTSEAIANLMKQQVKKVADVKGIEHFIIYNTSIEIPSGLFEHIDRNHILWSYPVGWKYPEIAPDNYELEGFLQNKINQFGFLILYLDLLITLFAIPLIFYSFLRRKNKV